MAVRPPFSKNMSEHFAAEQYEEAYPEGIENDFWTLARNRIILGALREHYDPTKPVLDVGCGRGITVDFLRKRGLDVRGCELGSPKIPESLRDSVFTNTDALALPEGLRREIGSILLLDVIEHIADPAPFLRGLRAAFPALRLLVVTVPARTELWSNYDTHYGHHRRYDFGSMRALADSLPAAVLRMHYFFHGLYLPMFAQVKWNSQRKVKLEAPKNLPMHRLLASLFYRESQILPGRLVGSSLLAALRFTEGTAG